MTEELFESFEFNESTSFLITEVNGHHIPEDYLAFMHEHNGGEGPIGEEGYLQLVRLEELRSFNEEYEIPKWLPDKFIFGTDLGGNLYGFDPGRGSFCSIDSCSIFEEDVFYAGETFEDFLKSVGDGEL